MSQYLVAVYDEPGLRQRPAAEMAAVVEQVSALTDEAVADGTCLSAVGLHEPDRTTSIDARSGSPVLSAVPEADEFLGGWWIIDVPDHDAAVEWGSRAAIACGHRVELRPLMEEPPAGS